MSGTDQQSSFKVRGEDDGKVYTVHVHHSWIGTGDLKDSTTKEPGLPEFMLDNGRRVTKIDGNTFQIPGGQRLKRI